MKTGYDPEKHHRNSIRVKNFDYGQQRAYFITVCVQDRRCILGDIVDGSISLSNIGAVVKTQWNMLPQRFAHTNLDAYVLMPNHLHGIISLVYPSEEIISTYDKLEPRTFQRPARNTIGEIIRTFKAATTRSIRLAGNGEFAWQRNYYEHIVRHEKDLERIRQYIINNPIHWEEDTLYNHA